MKALSTMSVKCQAWCGWMWLSRVWASEAGQLREELAGVGQVTAQLRGNAAKVELRG